MLKIKSGTPWLLVMIPMILGFVAFSTVIGWSVLSVENDSWLLNRSYDPLTHYLGWVFYRHGDYQWPIGANLSYGLEISNSIVYSDSIPLLAIIFKIFSIFLPTKFQYFGIWFLLCFLFQAYFSWIWFGYQIKGFALRILTTSFLLFIPAMLWRFEMHESLAAHSLVLAAFAIIFNNHSKWKDCYWTILIIVSALIMPYLAIMVLTLWIASLLDRVFLKREMNYAKAIKVIIISFLALFLAMYLSGYFVIPLGSTSVNDLGRFGDYPNNLYSFFNPNGWSYIWNGIPQIFINYEGFNYLGLGIICLIPFSAYGLWRSKSNLFQFISNNIYLLISILLLYLFSLSSNVHMGENIYRIPTPDWAGKYLDIFRCSGRMAWPLLYLLVYAVLVFSAKAFSYRNACIILFAFLILQVVDTSAGWLKLKKEIAESNLYPKRVAATNPFWTTAGKHYSNLRISPLLEKQWQPQWEHLAYIAAINQQNTNAVYLARIDLESVRQSNHNFTKDLVTKNFDGHSFFLLDDSLVLPTLINLRSNIDLLADIDNFKVFAPGWYECDECKSISITKVLSDDQNQSILKTRSAFFNRENKNLLLFLAGGHGWDLNSDGVRLKNKEGGKIVIPLSSQPKGALFLNKKQIGCHYNSLNIEVAGIGTLHAPLDESEQAYKLIFPASMSGINFASFLFKDEDAFSSTLKNVECLPRLTGYRLIY